jgi:phenylpropionate dioxygenase-like ring-hydroxylating dioxygenase large terminal subunit
MSEGAHEVIGASEFLRDLWYFALSAKALKPGRLEPRTICGEDLIFGRDADGSAFCLVDLCPHRGVPLRFAHFDGKSLTCCFHGWRFDSAGQLLEIPCLAADDPAERANIRVRRYACQEQDGIVWVHMASGGGEPATQPPVIATGPGPRIVETQQFAAPVDHAVIGLIDPAHAPFVHGSWWWRPQGSRHLKEKGYGPAELGFSMLRHRASSNSRLYRLLGGAPETEITFVLPGIRIETVHTGRHRLVSLTSVTPVGEKSCEVNQLLYWTQPWLAPFKPLLGRIAHVFLAQDRGVVTKQQLGLVHNPPLKLIGDPDQPAKWYLRLKREWRAASAEGREFRNPVEETTLRWTS